MKRRASTQRVAGRRVVAAASTHPKTTLSYNLLGFRVFNEPWSGRAPSNKKLFQHMDQIPKADQTQPARALRLHAQMKECFHTNLNLSTRFRLQPATLQRSLPEPKIAGKVHMCRQGSHVNRHLSTRCNHNLAAKIATLSLTLKLEPLDGGWVLQTHTYTYSLKGTC